MQSPKTAAGESERTKPEWISSSLQRGSIEHEVSVALCEEGNDLVVASAGFHLLTNLPPEIDRELRPRLGEGLVLADETAHLLRERVDTPVQFCVGVIERRTGADGREDDE
jgi:hypothetical protein